jgi:hypothetical protein
MDKKAKTSLPSSSVQMSSQNKSKMKEPAPQVVDPKAKSDKKSAEKQAAQPEKKKKEKSIEEEIMEREISTVEKTRLDKVFEILCGNAGKHANADTSQQNKQAKKYFTAQDVYRILKRLYPEDYDISTKDVDLMIWV